MKKTKLLLSLLSLSALIFTSCGKGDGSSQVPGDVSGETGISSSADPIFNNSSNGGDQSNSQGGGNQSSQGAGNQSSQSGGNTSVDVTTPTSIVLDAYELSLLPGGSKTINATVNPTEGRFAVEWTTSNASVATVENGVVTAVGAGTADITATVKGTSLSEKCVVSVAAEYHDYVKDGSVKLNLDYAGKSFYTDGIEKVSLLTPIDGDTSHFTTSTTTLKARFFGIDTPESTGKVQEWGVPASHFTKEKLESANKNGTIVISSPQSEYGAPDPDSTGSRYVSLVWINETKKNAAYDELYLLNLWIVQEGLSMKKNVSDFPIYETAFDNAQAQAQVYKLHMWSGERDPEFNYGDEGYADVSLLDIKREVEKSIKDQSYKNKFDNMLVRFTGVVSSYNDGTLYVQEFYPIDDDHPNEGEWAGINIFCGMQQISSRFTAPNTYIQVYGLCKDSETFGFQITDTQGKWKAYGAGDEDCKVLLKAELNTEEHSLYTFHYTPAQLTTLANNDNCESLFCAVQVNGTLTCNYCYVSDSRDITLGFAETKVGVYIPFAYHGDKSDSTQAVIRWDTKAQFEGKKFRIDAGTYAWHRTTNGNVKYQIIPTNEDSFVWLGE